MADDSASRPDAESDHIDVAQPRELRYWSDTLGCTTDELSEAVATVGPSVADVTQYLQERRTALDEGQRPAGIVVPPVRAG